MVIENCKKTEPVVVKLRSKTNIPLFFWTRCIWQILCAIVCTNTQLITSTCSQYSNTEQKI